MPSSSSGSWRGGLPAPRGAGPRLRWLRRRTIWRPMRRASTSSAAKWSARPLIAGVHVGAAEGLVVALLAGRHLHQRRAAEEHLRALVDHHDVVAHAGDVGPAGGRAAEDDGDGGDAGGRQRGEVAERLTAGDEDLALVGEVGAARLDELHVRQAVLAGDLEGAQALAHGRRRAGAAAHGGVVAGDDALDALDHTDAGEQAGADREVGAPRRQRRQLEQRRRGSTSSSTRSRTSSLPRARWRATYLSPPPLLTMSSWRSCSARASSIASRLAR